MNQSGMQVGGTALSFLWTDLPRVALEDALARCGSRASEGEDVLRREVRLIRDEARCARLAVIEAAAAAASASDPASLRVRAASLLPMLASVARSGGSVRREA